MEQKNRLVAAVRRFGLAAAGLAATGAVCLACSSSTGGTPAADTGVPTLPSVGVLSTLSVPSIIVPSISVPSIGLPSIDIPTISGLPSIGGDQANTAFCKDFTDFDPSTALSDPSSGIAFYDKLAADAPDEIKSDVETFRDYIKSILSGNPDPDTATKASSAINNMITYAAAHCAG